MAQWFTYNIGGTNYLRAGGWALGVPTFLPFTNVGLDAHLAVNVNTTSCPTTTGIPMPVTDYPLVVNGTTVLWDSSMADNVRKIIGLSVAGGIAVYSGNDDQTGSGIRLNAKGSLLYPPGTVQTISNSATGLPSGLAYEHINFVPAIAGSGTNYHLFQLLRNGNARISNCTACLPTATERLTVDGNIFINTTDGMEGYRNMIAKSTYAGLNISSGTNTDGSDGASFTTYASSTTIATGTEVYPGAIEVRSNYTPGPNVDLGYLYKNYNTVTASLHNLFLITKNGQGVFGPDIDRTLDIHNDDVFTVKDIIGFTSAADANTRYVRGNTNSSKVVFSALTNSSNAGAMELHGPTSATPGIVALSSFGTTGLSTQFRNYDAGASTWYTNVSIGNNGQTTIGHNIDISIAAPGDVLTVNDQLGFYDAVDATTRHINGNTNAGSLTLAANVNQNTGAVINMFGAGSSGAIQYFAYGTTDYGHLFLNVDPASGLWHNRMAVTNTGKVVIGEGLIDGYNTPGTYNLYVQNGIMTEMVRVALSTTLDWADYVFDTDFDLMPIGKLENYIKKNKHLPQLPSAKEVVKDGIDLGKMDAQLLQKIEELTLYAIQQQKQIDKLSAILDKLTHK